MSLTTRLVALLLLGLGLADAKVYKTRFHKTTWDDSNWRLETGICNQGHYQGRASIANGYIGLNAAALGPFFEVDTPVDGDMINGWPLFQRRQTFATVAGFWNEQPTTAESNYPWLNQYGGESTISGVPHWGALVPSCQGHVLDASTDLSEIKGFSSVFDFKAGTLSWAYTWNPPDCPSFDIEYQIFASKIHVNQAAVRMKITPSKDVDVTIVDVLDGDCAVRTSFVEKGFEKNTATIHSAVTPGNIHNVSAYVYSTLVGDSTVDMKSLEPHYGGRVEGHNKSSIAQSVTAKLKAGKTTKIKKYVGVASSDAMANPKAIAKEASLKGAQTGYMSMLQAHSREWRTVMPDDSVDGYQDPATGELPDDQNTIEQQILAVTNPYYILQNTVSKNAMDAAHNENLNIDSVSVGGLTSDSYAGMVFWDADVWMQPGIVISHPPAMRQVAQYRLAKRPQAMANVKTAYQSSQKNTKFSPNAAIYSWTSARFGNCTATGPCFDYEYHINGDIALQIENYYAATGDTAVFKNEYFPIYESAAQVYSDLFYLNKTTGTYMLKNATDPDEFANHVQNPGYTMLLAQTIMRRAVAFQKQLGLEPNHEWLHQADKIEIPIDKKAGLHLEYTDMPGYIQVKQADVVLIYDFLHYDSKYRLNDLTYYAGRQSQSGPAMTYGVFSIVAARGGPTGCSDYTFDLYGSSPYVRGPWFQFSEQLLDNFQANGGFHPAFPFLTGMGGANRVAPYGYLGLRLSPENFNIYPTLPPQIPNLRLRTIYWQGYAISAVMNRKSTTVTLLKNHLSTRNPKYAKGIPVSINGGAPHTLHPGASLTFETRRPDEILTVPRNVAQCKSVTYDQNQMFEPGQFPLSAVDGSSSTKWQPTNPGKPSSITVYLGSDGIVPVSGIEFDWAQAVPQAYKVTFSNYSDPTPSQIREAASSKRVKVSNPYNPKTIAEVRPYMSNTTSVKLSKPVWGGKYATLTIEGTHANKTVGATVAEWAIVKLKDY